jgi:hypothetical protein
MWCGEYNITCTELASYLLCTAPIILPVCPPIPPSMRPAVDPACEAYWPACEATLVRPSEAFDAAGATLSFAVEATSLTVFAAELAASDVVLTGL